MCGNWELGLFTPLDLTLPLTFSACVCVFFFFFCLLADVVCRPFLFTLFAGVFPYFFFSFLFQLFRIDSSRVTLASVFGFGFEFEVRVRATQCNFFLTCSIIKAPPYDGHIHIYHIAYIAYCILHTPILPYSNTQILHTEYHPCRLLCGLGFGLEEATNYFSR